MDLTQIQNTYGHTDLYTILSIPHTATSTQIREAYFCLRYEIYQKLNDEGSNTALTPEERREAEERMDAITSTFRILTDPNKRVAYDSSLNNDDHDDGEKQQEEGESAPTNASVSRNVFRRRASKVKPDRSRERPHAETVTSFRKKNVERGNAIEAEESYDSIFADNKNATVTNSSSVFTGSTFSKGSQSHFDSIFGEESTKATQSTLQTTNVDSGYAETVDAPPNTATAFPTSYPEHLPVVVDNLNMREQMLYKNQMYLHHSQSSNHQASKNKKEKSRIVARYEAEERDDWLVSGDDDYQQAPHEEESAEEVKKSKKRWNILKKKVSSPTGVDDFDSYQDSPKKKDKKKSSTSPSSSPSKSKKKISIVKPSRLSFDDSNYQDDDTRTYDDDTRTYDDDTTQYDDDTQYDDTTTLGGDTLEDTTVGDQSTYASYDDDTYASEGYRRFSPGHKKGNRPEPILKSGKGGGRGGDEKDDRRVTIHSHRGRKSRGDDKDFADTMCPFPSFSDVKEEIRGTCKDASSAFHQVLHAFVISPDDVDRMSDKIRDAKVELAETYHKQVKERKRASDGGARELRL